MKYYLLIASLVISTNLYANEKFTIEMVQSNNTGGRGAIRYNEKTGQSWFVKGGIFVEILEKKVPSRGKYLVKMVLSHQ